MSGVLPRTPTRSVPWWLRAVVLCAIGGAFTAGGIAARTAIAMDARIQVLEADRIVEDRDHRATDARLERIEAKIDRLTERLSGR